MLLVHEADQLADRLLLFLGQRIDPVAGFLPSCRRVGKRFLHVLQERSAIADDLPFDQVRDLGVDHGCAPFACASSVCRTAGGTSVKLSTALTELAFTSGSQKTKISKRAAA